MRFSAIHSARPTEKQVVVGVWIRVEEDLDDNRFAQFRRDCSHSSFQTKQTETVVEVKMEGDKGSLEIVADISTGKRLRIQVRTRIHRLAY